MAYETAMWPLQQAIFGNLESNIEIIQMVKGVFDSVPENQEYPYIVIGEVVENPFMTKNTFGEELDVTIHAWSEYSGKKQIYEILNACQKSLSKKLLIPGFEILKVELRGKTAFDDVNPAIKHGVLRIRYTINN